MGRLLTQVMRPPTGMQSAADALDMPPHRAAFLQDLLFDWNGILRGPISSQFALFNFPFPTGVSSFGSGINGVGVYYGSTKSLDALLFTFDGYVFKGLHHTSGFPGAGGSWVLGSGSNYSNGYFTNVSLPNVRTRMLQFNDELVILPQGSSSYRYNEKLDGGINLAALGIQTPLAPTISATTVSPWTPTTITTENWDGTVTGWNARPSSMVISSAVYVSAPNSLDYVAQTTSYTSPTFYTYATADTYSGNVQVQTDIYFDAVNFGNAALEAGVIARYNGTTGYYAAIATSGIAATKGDQVNLFSFNGSVFTEIISVTASTGTAFTSDTWYTLTFQLESTHLQVGVQRMSDGLWLNSSMAWQSAQTYAIDLLDSTVTGSGEAGIAANIPDLLTGPSSAIFFDNFVFNGLTETSGSGKTADATYSYKWTLVDEKGRESSPSLSNSVTLSGTQNAVTVNVNFGSDPQVKSGNLYVNTTGGNVWYFLVNLPNDGNHTTYTDSQPDSVVQSSTQFAPNPGENDPPPAATLGAFWNNRLVLVDAHNPSRLVISNLGSPTQFASYPDINNPNDGWRTLIWSDQGDYINGLCVYGGFLFVFKRRGIFLLSGISFSDFTIQQVDNRGCVAPDSVQLCDNVILFLSDDGVYQMSYFDAFNAQKLSLDIDDKFWGIMEASGTSTLWQNAVSFYSYHRYYIFLQNTLGYFYDFSVGGWGSVYHQLNYQALAVATQIGEAPLVIGGTQTLYADVPTGDGAIYYLDEQNLIGGVTGCTYTIHSFGGDRSTQRRAKRFILFGTANQDPSAQSYLQIYVDGVLYQPVINGVQVSSYPVAASNVLETIPLTESGNGIILYQEFDADVVGYEFKINVYLWGSAANIRDALFECEPMNPMGQ